MNNLEKVCNATHYNFPRNTILVPLATALDIDHTKFKNRRELINEIQNRFPPSKRCENTQDFITLCSIDDIPKKRLFIWSQNNKTYGADIMSLKLYIDSGKTMNPWTIDYATGVNDANDRDSYQKVFDMKHQRGLLRKINAFYDKYLAENDVDVQDNNELDCSPQTVLRFDIEKIGDEVDHYISHIIESVEGCDYRIFIYVLSDVLKTCMDYFLVNNDSVIVNIIEPIFINNELLKLQMFLYQIEDTPNNLKILSDVLNVIHQRKDVYYIGVLKYFVMEFEETLKNYNLLNR